MLLSGHCVVVMPRCLPLITLSLADLNVWRDDIVGLLGQIFPGEDSSDANLLSQLWEVTSHLIA